ncbi:MAG: hypothetical protein ABSH19_05145 [Opitutales bacterium]
MRLALMAAAAGWLVMLPVNGQVAVLPPGADAGNGQSPTGAILGSTLPPATSAPTVYQPVLTQIISGEAAAAPGVMALPPTAVVGIGAATGNVLPPGAKPVEQGSVAVLPPGALPVEGGLISALPPGATNDPADIVQSSTTKTMTSGNASTANRIKIPARMNGT